MVAGIPGDMFKFRIQRYTDDDALAIDVCMAASAVGKRTVEDDVIGKIVS